MLDKEFFIHTLQAMPDAVVLANSDRKILVVNRAFTELFGYEEFEVTGKKTSFLYASESDYQDAGKRTFNKKASEGNRNYELQYRKKHGAVFKAETTANVVKDDKGEVAGYLGIIRDLTDQQKEQDRINYLTEQLHMLVDITTQDSAVFTRKVEQALKLTTKFLNMEIGIISTVKGDSYVVDHFYPETAGLKKGEIYSLGETYCSITLKKGEALAIDHMSVSSHAVHPCYSKFKLESYIGIPLKVNGKTRGTINFSSSIPHEQGFSDTDLDMMRILGKWLSSQLAMHEAKTRIEETGKKYRLISERTLDMVCLHASDGTYKYVSPSSEWILGYKPDELIGKDPYSLFHPDDIGRVIEESHRQSKEVKRVMNTEYRIRTKDGAYIWFDTSTEPIINKSGEVTGLQTASREITYRKRLEILYSQAQKMTSLGGWEYDLRSGKLFWTDEVYRIHEKDPSDEVFVEEGLSYYPDDGTREVLQDAMNKTIETGKATDLELPFITAKGSHRFVRVRINAQGERGEAYKLYGTFQDITEKKKLENLFNDSQRIASVGGWEYVIESGHIFWTEEVYRIHDMEPGEVINVEEGIHFYPEEDGSRQKIMEALAKTIRSGEAYDLELSLITAKGRMKFVRAIGKALISDGKVYKLYGTFQDITGMKKAEVELRNNNTKLNRLLETNHQINSIIGHDLKTPLSSIVGLTDLSLYTIDSEEETDIEELKEYLSHIYTASNNMSRLLQDLLKWSRVQTGQMTVHPQEMSMKELLEPTLEMMRPAAIYKGIDILVNCNDELLINTDQTIVATIIRNFISNAIKFSVDGDSIHVNCVADKSEHRISVKDEGAGMPEGVMNALFHPTNHPSKKGTGNERGTGLGLKLAIQLAALLGGDIQVKSVLDEGSEFTLVLPREVKVIRKAVPA